MLTNKEEPKNRVQDMLFGFMLVANAVGELYKKIWTFPKLNYKDTNATEINRKLKIRFMTDKEVMEYLIKISNGKKQEA